MGFAAKLLLSLIGAVALLAVASQVEAADARPCQRLNAALDVDQRKKAIAWLHQEFPGTDFSLDYSCKVDAKRVAIAVVDFGGLQSAVYVLDVSGDAAQPRKLVDGAVEAPVVLTRPGGGLDLFYVQQEPDKTVLLRSYRVIGLDGSGPTTLFEADFDPRQRGCAFAAGAGVQRMLVAAAVRFTDMNKDGTPDIVIDREIEDCATHKSQRADQIFLATPQGWRPRP
jgi:hypothetical protein